MWILCIEGLGQLLNTVNLVKNILIKILNRRRIAYNVWYEDKHYQTVVKEVKNTCGTKCIRL